MDGQRFSMERQEETPVQTRQETRHRWGRIWHRMGKDLARTVRDSASDGLEISADGLETSEDGEGGGDRCRWVRRPWHRQASDLGRGSGERARESAVEGVERQVRAGLTAQQGTLPHNGANRA